jgi:hypothetical protein
MKKGSMIFNGNYREWNSVTGKRIKRQMCCVPSTTLFGSIQIPIPQIKACDPVQKM